MINLHQKHILSVEIEFDSVELNYKVNHIALIRPIEKDGLKAPILTRCTKPWDWHGSEGSGRKLQQTIYPINNFKKLEE